MKKQRKVVVVTGGSGRIGSALAEDLLKQGYKVLIGDINENKLIKIKKKLKSRNIEIFSGDLTIKKNIDSFISFGLKNLEKLILLCVVLIRYQKNGEQDLKILKKIL